MSNNSVIVLPNHQDEMPLSSTTCSSDSKVNLEKHCLTQCGPKLRMTHKTFLQTMLKRDYLPIITNLNCQCSTVPLSKLRRISIYELCPRIRYMGRYLILRTLETPFEVVCLKTVVEDDEGSLAIFCLFNFDVTPHRDIEDSWPVGTIFFLKEPYCLENQNGTYCLNCESPSDLVFVYDRPDLLELTHRIRWASDVDDPMYRQGVPESAEEWLALGSAFNSGGKTEIATRCHNLALYAVDRLPKEHSNLRLKIYSELFRCYYLKGFYEKALTFAEKVMEVDHIKEDTYFLAVKCHYFLRNYEIARHLSQFCLNEFPDYRNLDIPLQPQDSSHLEMRCGKFDMHKIFLAQLKSQEPINCQEYTGPIEIVAIEGKGRGVIATKNIRPGTLLVVSKALVFSCKSRHGEWWEVLVARLSSLITKNPKTFGPIIYSLFDGFNPVEEGNVKVFCSPETEQEPIVDIRKLKGIVKTNTIGDNGDIHVYKSNLMRKSHINNRKPGCGVYDMPSYFNHSCFPNASLHEYNDVVFIRAIKSIKSGEEVCFPYVSWDFSYASRKKLLSLFGFECFCGFCKLESNSTLGDIKLRHDIWVKCVKLNKYIIARNANFNSKIVNEFDDMIAELNATYANNKDFPLKVSMSTMYALRAKTYAMATCCHPEKKQQELESHLKTLSFLGLDPETLLISLENGSSLIPDDAILDESVFYACSRLIYLYHAQRQTILGKTWTWVFIALEKIYSGEDVNVLKLRYPYLKVYFDALNV